MKIYYETVTEFEYKDFNFRVWCHLPPETGVAYAGKTIKHLVINVIDNYNPSKLEEENDLKSIAKLLLEIQRVNAIQINWGKASTGIVLYKDWP